MSLDPRAADVIAFWREAGQARWFARDAELDRQIQSRFSALHTEAAAGRLDTWARTPDGSLALLLLLDQFSRNLYRGSARAFAQDEAARRIARKAIADGFDLETDPALRQFFYLPFMHSECILDQGLCVRLFHALGDPENLHFARLHEKIVRRFGRFPHRNDALGRHNSPAEITYLEAGGFSG